MATNELIEEFQKTFGEVNSSYWRAVLYGYVVGRYGVRYEDIANLPVPHIHFYDTFEAVASIITEKQRIDGYKKRLGQWLESR